MMLLLRGTGTTAVRRNKARITTPTVTEQTLSAARVTVDQPRSSTWPQGNFARETIITRLSWGLILT
jgi:hypothetical protein